MDMNLSEKELLEYNKVGLIPGPSETKEAFTERATYCLNLQNQIPEMLAHELPFSRDEIHLTNEILESGCKKARSIYDIFPSWVPLFFSNYKLSFWHGGCAWIFQQKQNSPTSAFFQLRQNFRKSKTYLGVYDQDELISHELSHVGRMMFEEPKFEEILAYRSSKSSFRRFFGPIVQSSYESTIFVLFLLLLITVDFFTITGGYKDPFSLSLIGRFGILCLISYALVRLWLRQKQFKGCLKNLRKTVSNIHEADAVIYRLTDDEIIAFSRQSPEEIQQYAEEQKTHTLRWKLLDKAYFKNKNSSDHMDHL